MCGRNGAEASAAALDLGRPLARRKPGPKPVFRDQRS